MVIQSTGKKRVVLSAAAACLLAFVTAPLFAGRQVINLNGAWQIAQGGMEAVPSQFDHTVPVPGLVDMAEPPFDEVGVRSGRRQAFWYRRTFTIPGPLPAVALLKVHKAKFGTAVYCNGRAAGEHLPCFTPGYFDVRDALKGEGQENVLVIRVGAFHDALPSTVQWGHDFEKIRYLPGIYDTVELHLTGAPFIRNIQTVPDVTRKRVRVLAEIHNPRKADRVKLSYTIREARSRKQVAQGSTSDNATRRFTTIPMDCIIPLPDCRLWSPDDPFLYELALDTGHDRRTVRFGMRSLRFDKHTGRAVLNGRTYFMRGTNICMYRFFEDPAREDRPWREEWVRRLHRQFKHMHWNSIRYCIGFPPEIWYRVADEEGLLIQDEYPIWNGGNCANWPAGATSEHVAAEYTEWMRERWNHPCVVIWDAQNETVTPITGQAIRAVRSLDISNRPWENGWSAPQHPDDPQETHPYMFSGYRRRAVPPDGPLSHFTNNVIVPGNGPNERNNEGIRCTNPIIINEYGWLWLNRDGSPTTLTEAIYPKLLGPDATTHQRRECYARYLAALTEYWRGHRQCAGVLHFCGLAYSRPAAPRGQTSDHFTDLEALTYEPSFETYVRDAFAPVGLMIDFWQERVAGGATIKTPVIVVNDLYRDWKGTVHLRMTHKDRTVKEQSASCTVDALGRVTLDFSQPVPEEEGTYELVAELTGTEGKPVRSLRSFTVRE
jgi:hypothetical protein